MRLISKTGIAHWYVKGGLYWVVFMVLYLVHKFIPAPPLRVICAVSESNFQHYKASFFSWIILSALEFGVARRKIGDRQAFLYSRLATATLLPWFVFVLWYIAPAVYGKMPSIPLEILYANIITMLVGCSGGIFEQGLSRITYTRGMKTVILLFTLISLMHYMVFTFVKLPWADVFIEPDWR